MSVRKMRGAPQSEQRQSRRACDFPPFNLVLEALHLVMHDKILILDFGSQVTQLIARRVREAQVYCEIHPLRRQRRLRARLRREGRHPVRQPHVGLRRRDRPRAAGVFDLGVPVLGICYGMQTMAQQLGGKVEAGAVREFGYAEVRARGHTQAARRHRGFRAPPKGHGMLDVWMSHGDKVTELPPGFKLMASTDSCPIAGMADDSAASTACSSTPR
jgi:GMP synthase (glutamine-hydrolysing)